MIILKLTPDTGHRMPSMNQSGLHHQITQKRNRLNKPNK
jgi:hypothetical protein